MNVTKLVDNDEAMSGLILEIAKSLVDERDAVSVKVQEEDNVRTIHLHVAVSDRRKITGKQSQTLHSLTTILSAASMKLQKRYNLFIDKR